MSSPVVAAEGAPAATGGKTAVTIPLGTSVARIYGPWKFHIGDSPNGDSNPLWAVPAFDDSSWETVDLTPKKRHRVAMTTDEGVAGWTARGHAGVHGYGWYRIAVQVENTGDSPLAIEGPEGVDDVYQVFVDGKLAGSFGKFSPGVIPASIYTQPAMFPVPAGASHVIAIRVYYEGTVDALSPFGDQKGGGLRSSPRIGTLPDVSGIYQLAWLERLKDISYIPFTVSITTIMTLFVGALFLYDRTDRAYGWLTLSYLVQTLDPLSNFLAGVTNVETVNQDYMAGYVLGAIGVGASAMVWWTWFGLRRPRWIPALIAGLCFVRACGAGIVLLAAAVPRLLPAVTYVDWVITALRVPSFLILVVTAFYGIRQGKADKVETRLVVLALALKAAGFIHTTLFWYPFTIPIPAGTVQFLSYNGVIAILLMRRLLLAIRRQDENANELKQAQEIQTVFLPEAISIPGYAFDTLYRPAREVGGDFFQIIPHASGESVLLAVGDVGGKGLQAGMLVAVLIGGMRSTAEINDDPKVVLSALNRRLIGRGDASATCLVMKIDLDGSVTMANAGHLSPYRNGEEIPMEGALPLGMDPDAEFSITRFHLDRSDTLLMISDGILEAQNERGELFGFARVKKLLQNSADLGTIADAAQAFGQEDDISVVSVTREAIADALTSQPARAPISSGVGFATGLTSS